MAPFRLTASNWKKGTELWKAGQKGQAIKNYAKSGWHGAVGTAKVAVPVAAGASLYAAKKGADVMTGDFAEGQGSY